MRELNNKGATPQRTNVRLSRSFQSRTFLEIAKQDKLFGAIGE
jgi:hypothetical protein